MQMQTVYPFTLPKGYIDAEGNLHREGRMRLATAGDELGALRDARVKADESYLNTIILSKVIVELETLQEITPEVIEGLFIADMEFLQNIYDTINRAEKPQIQVTCPHCGKKFVDTINFQGAG